MIVFRFDSFPLLSRSRCSCSFPPQNESVNDPPDDNRSTEEAIRAPRLASGLTATKMARVLPAVALLALLSVGLCEEKVFLQRAGTAFNSRSYESILNVTNGEKFGDWTWPEMCPENFYAVGFSLRVNTHTGVHLVWEEKVTLTQTMILQLWF